MLGLIAPISAKPGQSQAFTAAALDDARNSVKEPGCYRFDVHQDLNDANKFYLYENYKDEAAFEHHRSAPHLARFREAIKDIRAPSSTPPVRCSNVFPLDKDLRSPKDAQWKAKQYIILATLNVKPEHKSAFVASLTENARGAVTEPGCLRFDVLQDAADPNCMHIYEVYRDQAALAAHQQTPHFQAFHQKTQGMHASPTVATRCTNLFPPG